MSSGARLWRRFPADLFRFTTTDLRDLHVALMAVFDESAVVSPALRVDDVRRGLQAAGWDEPVDDERLDHALRSLVGWGLLEVTQDHGARYATPEEFERRNLQWSLTPHGQAAIGGVQHAADELRRAVSLQPAVLDAIADGLGDLHRLMSSDPPGPAAQVNTTLSAVESHLESLVSSVRQFNTHLQRLLREDATEDEVFLDVKRRTITYLEDYIAGVERPARRVAVAIGRAQAEVGVSALHDRALLGANLAPLAGGDPAPAWLEERARRWDALVAWFAPARGEPRIALLVGVGRQAILQLLRVLERRFESRRRSSSIAQDFRTLARWFAGAVTDDEAHELFDAAFGMWPARHAHLVLDDEEARAPATSWLEAPPVPVAPALRTSTSLVNRGQAKPVPDAAAVRARRQREQAEALADHQSVRAALATGGAVNLARFGRLAPEAFAELLVLLSDALSAVPAADGSRRAMSADGGVEIVLTEPRPGAAPARLATATGVLTAPDFAVTVTLLGAWAGERERQVARA
ncbi:MAG: TIGR02677 family protein [Actinomycetota bacterium]